MELTRHPYILGGVGKGWETIVEECDKALAAIDPDYCIAQIKEKFGGLRFYYDSNLDYDTPERGVMDQIVNEAEARAAVTCEQCGKPGKIHPGFHWLKTLCDECNAGRKPNWY